MRLLPPTPRRSLTVLAVIAATALAGRPVRALDNAPADKQNHFSNVGAVVIVKPPVNVPGVGDIPTPWVAASGVLIHPRVMLTAGHVVSNLEQGLAAGNTLDGARVSFGPDAYQPDSWIEIEDFAKHPGYRDANGKTHYIDVGVVLLKTPAKEITPAPLPAPYLLDQLLDAGALGHGNDDPTLLDVVGYGVAGDAQVRADGLRHSGVQGFFNLTADWVYTSNKGSRGYSKSFSGDSGGPLFWTDPDGGEHLIAVDSGWNNSETFARLDLPGVLDWLDDLLDTLDD